MLQIVLSLSPGGTERLVIDIATRLVGRASIAVCCLDEPGTWAAELEASGIPVTSLARRPGFRPSLGYALAQAISGHGASVVHCHHYSPFVYGQLAALLRPSVRVLFTEHGRLSDAAPSMKRRMVNTWLGRLPERIFAVSADLRRHMIAEGLPAGRIEVVYNGVDPGELSTDADRLAARQLLAATPGETLLGTVGRLDSVKDLRTMIHAVAAGRQAGHPWRLAIVGDGPERTVLEGLASTLGVAEFVRFAGFRRDVRLLLPAFDLYVCSSTHEGVSLTILEAMAAGLPVVATAVGGNPEVVVGNVTGVLVPPRRPDRLTDALLSLAEDAPRRTAFGRAGRARVLEAFTVDRMVERYFEAYCGKEI